MMEHTAAPRIQRIKRMQHTTSVQDLKHLHTLTVCKHLRTKLKSAFHVVFLFIKIFNPVLDLQDLMSFSSVSIPSIQ